MFKIIAQIIILIASIGIFAGFTSNQNKIRKDVKAQTVSVQTAIDNYTKYEAHKSELESKKDSLDAESLKKLDTLLPSNVNNMHLVIDINSIAKDHGLFLKNIKFNQVENSSGENSDTAKSDLGSFEAQFSTEGKYSDFVSFIADLERNERLVDIQSVSFLSPDVISSSKSIPLDYYKYEIKLRAYWLKDNK